MVNTFVCHISYERSHVNKMANFYTGYVTMVAVYRTWFYCFKVIKYSAYNKLKYFTSFHFMITSLNTMYCGDESEQH